MNDYREFRRLSSVRIVGLLALWPLHCEQPLGKHGYSDRWSGYPFVKAPTHMELGEVLNAIIGRTTKHLEKRGIIRRDEDSLQIDLQAEDDALTRLQAGAATYRFALGPNKGKKALTLKTVPDTDHVATRGLVAKNSGFSLHAGVAMTGTEREKIEKLCRYIARPALALERLSLNQRGQVVYTLKKPYDDGTGKRGQVDASFLRKTRFRCR